MFDGLYVAVLLASGLVMAAALSSLVAFRFGAPLLLIFLGIGLVVGENGLGLAFDDAPVAYVVGALALAVVLFDSGFGTSVATLRQAAAPALMLATLGTVLTTALFALPAHFLVGLPPLQALLLGSVVASTDAAAVFFLLNAGGLNIRERIRSTLEIESGSNDPIAIFLTVALVQLIIAGEQVDGVTMAGDVLGGFLLHMIGGVIGGVLGGLLIQRVADRLPLDQGLLPIAVLSLAFLVFAITGLAQGSGFLAVYVAGIVAGNSGMRATAFIRRFKNGLSWLSQIVMFLVLGLYATPAELLPLIVPAVGLAAYLMVVARPLAAAICLLPFRFSWREVGFVGWVGLRGAVSILLGLVPILGFVGGEGPQADGRIIFNIAFIIVLVSLAVQGWTIGPMARLLGLIVPRREGALEKVELELPGSAHHELLAYRVAPGSPVARGAKVPRWARPSLVLREGNSMTLAQAGRLREGDRAYIFVQAGYPPLLDRLFTGLTPISADDEEFFGAFPIDPSQPLAALCEAYDLPLPPDMAEVSVGEFLRQRLHGRAEYADRVAFGEVELMVREADGEGHVTAAGLSLESQITMPPAPTHLRATGAVMRPALARAGQGLRHMARQARAALARPPR